MEQDPSNSPDALEVAALLVEQAIRTLGPDPAAVRMKTAPPGRAWSLMRGSAAIAVFLRPPREAEDAAVLRVVSPIVLVGDGPQEELYRTLLELNASALGSVAFGLHQGRVVVVSERATRDLQASEVLHLLARTGAVADHYDDELVHRFGGTRVSDR